MDDRPKTIPFNFARVESATRRLESQLIDPRALTALDDLRQAYLDVFREMSDKAKDIHGMEDVLAAEVQTLVARFGWAMSVLRRLHAVQPDATRAAMAEATAETGVEGPDPAIWL
ncbi:MAG: hypothetical protein FJZ01_18270 [Candidatus Sericytochromatia bacterium]|nr:hypothetical protein [Candidatus Tanganyikabacteria bacterium]